MIKKLQQILSLTVVVGGIFLVAAPLAPAAVPNPAAPLLPSTTVKKGTWLEAYQAEVTATSSSSARVLANGMAKGLPKKYQKRCRYVGAGTDVPTFTNSGTTAFNRLWLFGDRRRSKVCLKGRQWYRVACGNKVWFRPAPVPPQYPRFTKTYGEVEAREVVDLEVLLKASCGYVRVLVRGSATARGRSRAEARGNAYVVAAASAAAKLRVKISATISCKIEKVVSVTVTPPPPGVPPVIIPKEDTGGPSGAGTSPPPATPPVTQPVQDQPQPPAPPTNPGSTGGDSGTSTDGWWR